MCTILSLSFYILDDVTLLHYSIAGSLIKIRSSLISRFMKISCYKKSKLLDVQ